MATFNQKIALFQLIIPTLLLNFISSWSNFLFFPFLANCQINSDSFLTLSLSLSVNRSNTSHLKLGLHLRQILNFIFVSICVVPASQSVFERGLCTYLPTQLASQLCQLVLSEPNDVGVSKAFLLTLSRTLQLEWSSSLPEICDWICRGKSCAAML